MWHEARRQERKIRGMLVDYRKRAERRRDFYEKIKADPTQFLQIHGRQCKIHLDPAIAAAADSAVMMPWQGNENNLIDRFDVRAHLDIIPPVKKEETLEGTPEERHLNYERYRIIAQNAYLGISEEKFLKQLHLEEQFGYTESKSKKDSKGSGVAIGFNYEEGTAITAPIQNTQSEDEEDNSDSDLDVDLAINVSKIDSSQAHEMNKHGQQFGMAGNDFYSYLTNDMEEAESYKLAREEEHEKALYSGRKSRRERRAHREKRLANRKISPPSYAAKESPTHPLKEESRSRSRSISPEAEKITYITSFGDDEEPANNKPSYADMVKYGKPRASSSNSNRKYTDSASLNISTRYSENRYKRSRSRSRQIRSRSRSRKRSSRYLTSRSRSPRLKRVKSQSRSPRSSLPRKNSRSRSTSRGRSRNYQHSRSRSLVKSCRKRSSSSKSRSRSSSSSLSSSSSSSRSSSRNRSFYRRRTSSTSSSLSSDSIPRRKSISKSPPRKSKSPEAPAPPRIRYYGRKKSDVSTSESSTDSDDNNDNNIDKKSVYTGTRDLSNRFGNNSGSVSKKPSSAQTVIERLKLKRQALINRQFKKDKIAEVQKIMREKQAQQTREDELREMAIKLRKRQRELRHAYDRSSSSDSEISNVSRRKDSSGTPERTRDTIRDNERRDRDKRSSSKDKNRRESRRSRSKDKTKRSRSSSRTRRLEDRTREGREAKRACRSPETRKLVDY